jgi:hypothetical protein
MLMAIIAMLQKLKFNHGMREAQRKPIVLLLFINKIAYMRKKVGVACIDHAHAHFWNRSYNYSSSILKLWPMNLDNFMEGFIIYF